MIVTCSGCGKRLKASEKFHGKTLCCPQCDSPVKFISASAPPTSSSPDPQEKEATKLGFDVNALAMSILNQDDAVAKPHLTDAVPPVRSSRAEPPIVASRHLATDTATFSAPPQYHPKKQCPYCAESISIDAKKCKHCGEFIDGSSETSDKRIFPALLLLFFFQGLGLHAFYCGRVGQGLCFLGVSVSVMFWLFMAIILPEPSTRVIPLLLFYGTIFLLCVILLSDFIHLIVGAYKDSRGRKISRWL